MGRKLDLSGLSDNEAEHVLQVVQRDMRLRKKEEERLREDYETILSEMQSRSQSDLLLLCSYFLLNPKRQCRDCLYNVCKACRLYSKPDKAWLCCALSFRLLKQQSLDWFYTHVKGRFKRFGSAKVLKTIYRRHLAERSPVSELTGTPLPASSGNDGFYAKGGGGGGSHKD
uniref:RabBD domain-containing protein n=1 Tax=Hippocampus comes TaxID=109280 RepID=A0A3Q2YKE3_HIPCM